MCVVRCCLMCEVCVCVTDLLMSRGWLVTRVLRYIGCSAQLVGIPA